ncbi:MAG: hypothetical protein ACFFCS_22840 [Candidatus Hodarchaeota archaeon]
MSSSIIKPTKMDIISERISRIHPFIELAIVLGSYVGINWIWLPLARLGGLQVLEMVGIIIIIVLLIWMVIFSHYFRGRTLEELGCTNPVKFRLWMRKLIDAKGIRNEIMIIGAYTLILVLFLSELLDATALLPFLGDLNRVLLKNLDEVYVIIICIIEYEVLFIITTTFMLKVDNIRQSFSAHFTHLYPLIFTLILIGLLVYPDLAKTQTFMVTLAHFFSYIFWGFIQQVPFMAYTATMLRDGFEKQSKIKPRHAKKLLVAAINGAMFYTVHLPTLELSIIASIMSFSLTLVYYEENLRNLFMTSVFHAIIGVIVVFFFNIDMQTTYVALFSG